MILEDIEIFLLTVQTRNISKTATQLYMAQSSVSHRIAALENELGFCLFMRKRGRRILELTPEGMDFIPIAERWLTLIDETNNLIANKGKIHLSIGSISSINRSFFAPIYSELLDSKDPPITLDIRSSQSAALYTSMEQHEHDIAFIAQLSHHNTIQSFPLFSEPMIMVKKNTAANPGTPIFGDAIDPLELDSSTEIGTHFQSRYLQWRKNSLKRDMPFIVSTNDPTLNMEFLNRDNTWCLVTSLVAMDFASKLPLEIHPVLRNPPERVCYMLTNGAQESKQAAFHILFHLINKRMKELGEKQLISVINYLDES